MSFLKSTFTIFILLWIVLLCITFNRHIRREPYTYNSEIFGDKAGYYVYLPATFIYHWNGNEFPDSVDSRTGNGFKLIDNYVVTKYPLGVALLTSPFFIINHYFFANPNDGFSFSYTLLTPIASTFYVLIGLFLCYRMYSKYLSKTINLLVLLTLFLGTNLFYYTILETGMSHSFSFFAFTLLLYLIIKYKNQLEITSFNYTIIGFVLGLIFLIRPINILFTLPYFLILLYRTDQKNTFQYQLLFTKKTIYLIGACILSATPLLIYYAYASKISLPYDGSTDKGFIYLFEPKILQVLFAHKNGMFVYCPLLLFLVVFYIFKIKEVWSKYVLLLLSCVVLVYSMWFSYELGCGFGHRSMVEFYSFFFLPLVMYLKEVKTIKIKMLLASLAVLCIVYTTKMALSYDGCFYSACDWDSEAYFNLLFSNIK